jgi:hypothetical protein
MSKTIKLTGETEILAAIYDPDNEPSAVLSIKEPARGSDAHPYCLHSLRNGSLTDFTNTMQLSREVHGGGSPVAFLTKRFANYPEQTHLCHGCYKFDGLEQHVIKQSAVACTKQFEDCA